MKADAYPRVFLTVSVVSAFYQLSEGEMRADTQYQKIQFTLQGSIK